ncbi:TNFL4 factor, partial [Steatornis caripensis]|nr:TNFL4 factor [Steatornis caripensis]
MEGQPDAERRNPDRADSEKEPAEDEWKSLQRGQVRNTLYLVSAAAQWTLLLACFVYLGIHSLQPSTTFVTMGSSLLSAVPGQSLKGVAVNFTTEGGGSIQIRNGSIMITCDGLYLVSLKGKILLPDLKEADLLKLTLGKMEKTTNTSLWE